MFIHCIHGRKLGAFQSLYLDDFTQETFLFFFLFLLILLNGPSNSFLFPPFLSKGAGLEAGPRELLQPKTGGKKGDGLDVRGEFVTSLEPTLVPEAGV